MFLILDITTADCWPAMFAADVGQPQPPGPHRIPHQDRCTVLQRGTREQAETEVVRLLKASPGRRYGLFECVAQAHTDLVPWAVTVGGEVVSEVRVPRWTS